MKTWIVAALFAGATLAITPLDADAKRLGGGKSQGMQRDMPARTTPDAAPGKPATPAQASPQATPGTPAAAPAKRSWMGPLAGLAAGLGLAALFSSLGMSGAMGSLLLMVLLAVVAFVVIRLVMRRMSSQTSAPSPVSAYSGSPQAGGTQVAWPQPGGSSAGSGSVAPQALAPVAEVPAAVDAAPGVAAAPVAAQPAAQSAAPAAKVFVPAAFDSEGFERAAKLIFIRMQAANDTADLEDLRSFTTPELFAAIRLDLQERGNAKQTTDVVQVNAQVLDVSQEGEKQVVSVRFHGEVREEVGAAPTAFNEVWHLVKPLDDSRSWAVAGIEQMN